MSALSLYDDEDAREQRTRKPRKEVLDDAADAFAAVFGQSAKTRISILRVLRRSINPLRYKDLLNSVRSELGGGEMLSEQNFNYHIKDLKKFGVVDQDITSKYIITTLGALLLSAYEQVRSRTGGDSVKDKPGFVGELNVIMQSSQFDAAALGEELIRQQLFMPVPSADGSVALKWRDDDESIDSEIELHQDGTIYVKVIVYEKLAQIAGYQSEDLDKASPWYDTVISLAKAMYYYVSRAARRLWPDVHDEITIEDSYPINRFLPTAKRSVEESE